MSLQPSRWRCLQGHGTGDSEDPAQLDVEMSRQQSTQGRTPFSWCSAPSSCTLADADAAMTLQSTRRETYDQAAYRNVRRDVTGLGPRSRSGSERQCFSVATEAGSLR